MDPVPLEVFQGEWKGAGVDTGHPGIQKNKELRWAGKTFRSPDDVDPMVLYDDEGKRVWKEDTGRARVSLPGVFAFQELFLTSDIILGAAT